VTSTPSLEMRIPLGAWVDPIMDLSKVRLHLSYDHETVILSDARQSNSSILRRLVLTAFTWFQLS
jgi:hypothetical protein